MSSFPSSPGSAETPPPSPPPPGDSQQSPPAKRPFWPGWLAGALIALSVISAVLGGVLEKRKGEGSGADEPNQAKGFNQEFAARYLVGMNTVLGRFLEISGHPKQEWLASFEEAARSPRERLELDILRRELSGPNKHVADVPAPKSMDAEEKRDWSTWEAILESAAPSTAEQGVNEAERRRFEERYGWVGRLALSQGRPDHDPLRARVLNQARRSFLGSITLMTLVAGALAAGMFLGPWATVRFATGRTWWKFPLRDLSVAATGAGSVWLETFAVYLTIMIIGGGMGGILPGAWAPSFTAIAFLGAAATGLWWPAMRGLPRPARRAGFGIHPGRGLGREIAAGLVGYLAGLPIIALGAVMTIFLTMKTKADASHPLQHLTGAPVPLLVLLGFLAAVWAPVVEELFFRGAFYTAWRQRWGRWGSAFSTGVIFAAVHPQGWTAIPALGAIGVVLALLREWRSSAIAPITAHALNNGTLFAMMIVMLR